MQRLNLSMDRFKKKPEENLAPLRFQDYIPKIIKEYEIKPPQTFRIWALAKKNLGYIETVVKSLEDKMDGTKPENAGLLISKLFPKKPPKQKKTQKHT